jgi:hypothetical protein
LGEKKMRREMVIMGKREVIIARTNSYNKRRMKIIKD